MNVPPVRRHPPKPHDHSPIGACVLGAYRTKYRLAPPRGAHHGYHAAPRPTVPLLPVRRPRRFSTGTTSAAPVLRPFPSAGPRCLPGTDGGLEPPFREPPTEGDRGKHAT